MRVMNTKPKRGHKSYESAFNGIALWQQNNYPKLIQAKDGNQYSSKLNKIMIDFLKSNFLPFEDYGTNRAINKNSNTVQDNWKVFKVWVGWYCETHNMV